jgi:anti-anti-sigma factor
MQSTVGLVVLDGTAMVSAAGEFDFFNADVLRNAVRNAAMTTTGTVCLDLSAVSFLDMTAARAILVEHQRLRPEGRGVRLLSPNPTIRRLLTAMDVDDQICA